MLLSLWATNSRFWLLFASCYQRGPTTSSVATLECSYLVSNLQDTLPSWFTTPPPSFASPQLMSCPVSAACSATAEVVTFPLVRAYLCSYRRCWIVLPVCPMYALTSGNGTTSAVAEHAADTGHAINWGEAKVVDSHPHWKQRCILESWYIQQQAHTINKEQGQLPQAYRQLIRAQPRSRAHGQHLVRVRTS